MSDTKKASTASRLWSILIGTVLVAARPYLVFKYLEWFIYPLSAQDNLAWIKHIQVGLGTIFAIFFLRSIVIMREKHFRDDPDDNAMNRAAVLVAFIILYLAGWLIHTL